MRSFVLVLFAVACNQGEPELTTTTVPSVDRAALFVVNGADASVSVIDADGFTALGEIAIEGASYPHHIYLSPDRTMLGVALPGVDFSGGHAGHSKTIDSIARVAVLDATTGALIASRILDAPNHNAIFTPDGRELWTALSTSPGKILVLDAKTLDEIDEIPVGDAPREITFSSDGRFAFVANGESNDVSVIDPESRRVIGEVAVGERPVGAWPGGDGFMYVDNEGSRTISAIDEASHDVVRTYALDFTPGFAAVSNTGELWVTDSLRGRVVFYAAGSDEIAGDMTTGIGAHAIAFSADGARGFITNQDAGSVSVVDVATKSVVTQILVGRKPNGLVYRDR